MDLPANVNTRELGPVEGLPLDVRRMTIALPIATVNHVAIMDVGIVMAIHD